MEALRVIFMGKKFFAVLILLILVFSFGGCGEDSFTVSFSFQCESEIYAVRVEYYVGEDGKRPLLRRKTILHLVRAKKLPFPLPLPIFQRGQRSGIFIWSFISPLPTERKRWRQALASLHRMEIHILIPFMETERMAFACKEDEGRNAEKR